MRPEKYEEAIGFVADEIKTAVGTFEGDVEAYAQGLFDGMVQGQGMTYDAFLAIHGTEQRLRYLTRQVFIRKGVIKDAAAAPNA